MSAKKKQQDQLPPYREVDDASSPADSESEAGGEEEPIDPSRLEIKGPELSTKAELRRDGTIRVSFNAKKKFPDLPPDYALPVREYGVDLSRPLRVPVLNIVIMIVGSRGDVQPYLAAALELIKTHGHRVRIATHDVFESFVLQQASHLNGRVDSQGKPLKDHLEFFGIGGDPKELMAYMVKNPGLMPGIESLTNGDIGRKKGMIKEMLQKFYRSTFQPCPQNGRAFAADAIISNPPAFAHIHAAEALGLPLVMSFTMPWSPTTEFSHPLVAIEQSNTPSRLTNYLTFAMAANLTWQGLGSTINRFRKKKLGLDKISMLSGASVLDRLKLPYIYCWSAELIPKPKDWMQNIDITGFLFVSSPDYHPEPDLVRFLKAGPTPIYVGFGSIVVDDPDAFTRLLFEAIKQSGVRALLSAGWSKMGNVELPENIFLLGDIPHDWLFAEKRVAAVCNHGGAGTTAIALKHDLPVVVVPFFGDQPFWGSMIANRGAGPEPLPYKTLTAPKLAAAIDYTLSDQARLAAAEVGAAIRNADGAANFAEAFHAHLPLLHMRCDIDPSRAARWWSQKYALRLSTVAAEVLIQAGKIKKESLDPWRRSLSRTRRLVLLLTSLSSCSPGPREYATDVPITDPVSGGAVAVLSAVTEFGEGFFRIFSSRPDKGLLLMVTAPPKAIVTFLTGLTEGLETLPSLYGTKERRSRTKVTGAGSGFIAGGKGLAFGFYDGISGLVLDPWEGAKKSGGAGFAKGLARASVNLAVQPAAGMFGLLSHPVKGIGKSVVNSFRPELGETVLRQPRIAMGVEEAREVDTYTKENMISQFDKFAATVKDRRKVIKKEAELWLRELEIQADRSREIAEVQRNAL
ncbi:hypothetical protein NliqN6_1610 [Naganishia liquefaciens]|uniref:Glycosyltransferase family 28 N-terminal domain-containing protein n=1 Tax=Naganishia liquefaciens TaxID=104408 RepID=A0A8H3YDH0_9TREE|nr:hypothetical protein NliqN6_1610 [Naganishia liquefaciens]